MTSLGAGLVWSGVQVSLLILAGAIVYVLLRRRGPAAGSLVALALLTIAIGLSALALSPWPSWWRLRAPAAFSAMTERAEAPSDISSGAGSNDAAPHAGANAEPREAAHDPSKSASSPADAALWARTFWQSLWDGLSDHAATGSTTASRWPSVAAWLLAIGMGLGFARLALGLAAVRAYRRRTRPVTDAALNMLLDAMRARLDCHRAIELRESAEIGSPATVGWRRPLVLLPPEWREWSENERQVVLAHEVAHVVRGDFAGWLVAQLSVALHFYNPLVHWLARRLRIEQELAADAWGAMAAGGSGPYLMTLASMALRQDDRAASWTARPFLPARGTLLRRIEMLRDRKHPQAFTFSGPKRIALWTVLAALGIVVAGLRGPSGNMPTADAATADEAAGLGGALGTQPIDLAYVPAEAALVVAVRPADLIKSDAGKLLMQSDPAESKRIEEKLAFPLSEIEYAKFVITDFRTGAPSRIILQSAKPRDWAKFAATIVPDPVAAESTLTALAGKKYFKPGDPKALHSYPEGTMCYFLPDERTIIFAPEHEMPTVLAASINPEPEPKWAKTWQRAATGHLAVMLDVEKLRNLIEPDLKRGSGGSAAAITAMLGPLWQDCQRVLVGTELGDKKLGLLALAECPNEEAAGRVEHTSQALLTFALNGLAEARRVDAGGTPDLIAIKKLLVGAAEELLKQARVTREGSTVVVQSQGGGATFLAAAGVALPAIQKARESASRAVSMNNLKQLALAMHVYNDAHGHLPPAVVMGPDGKTPHSWRVELLPNVEQDQLYKQYKQDEPWDSDANKKVLAQMPSIFRSPSNEPNGNNADYFVLTGKGTMFSGKDGIKFTDITGGTSNTIMIVEAKRDIPWTKPEDIDYDPSQPLPKLGGDSAGGFSAAFADGSVRFISQGVQEKSLKALIDPSADAKAKLDPNWIQGGARPPGTPKLSH